MYQISLPKIHKEGFLFIGIFLGITLILSLLSSVLGYIGLIFTGWCAYFFRDPDRVVPTREGLIVSPADGVVHAVVEDAETPEEMDLPKGKWTRISIFLNVFNVHVNRVPVGGKIIKSVYHPGKFLNASLDKASKENERQALVVETKTKDIIGFTQIAGLIARRIRCDIREQDEVKTGQRFGLIRFGSRCDVYLPASLAPQVIVGQKTIAGETVLADMAAKDAHPLEGEIL
ncbi:MAG: phosphatidylserine decarboxylase [Alphaproteobacteria bacterium]|nr:phosphatidylserine decarboxylase [Alphaproteobacteria bacterium]NCQ66850.1 phosphatidylserine decarboxylase [Alphaproteobacteria bacterium]NCT07418.1 phosphatidylserine decarboxylase [Alphaproteobacteria bacterium]